MATSASAEAFRTPSISAIRVEWRAVLDQLRSEISTQPAVASRFTFSGQRRVPPWDPRSTPALVQLNAITSPIFAGIGRSPVPVLLPFDTARYLEAGADGASDRMSVSRYQADFRPVDLFHAGPSGYDAVFSLDPGAGDGLPSRTFARPVEVQITGSSLIYDLADPRGGKGDAGQGARGAIPGYAPLHPRRLCALRLHPLRRALCGVDPVPGLGAARAAAGLPRGLSNRGAFPESAAHRRRTTGAAALRHPIRNRRTAQGDFTRLHLSPERRHHRP